MARSCWFSIMRSNHLRRIWARSLPVRAAQAWRADSAAFMAVAASLRDKSGRLARMSPRAGVIDGEGFFIGSVAPFRHR